MKEARIWQRRHGGNLVTMYPFALSARQALKVRLGKMDQYCQDARRVAACLARVPGVRIQPAPPHTNLFHAYFPWDAERLLDASAEFARARSVALFTRTRVCGASYLELARVLIDHGAQTNADLAELWGRIVFNMLVSNTDDHLRKHGFILIPGKGWSLSQAYDMNPSPGSNGLKLNVSEADNAQDLDLARSVAPFFRVSRAGANEVIERSQAVVRQWPKVAKSLRIPAREQQRLATAFRLAE